MNKYSALDLAAKISFIVMVALLFFAILFPQGEKMQDSIEQDIVIISVTEVTSLYGNECWLVDYMVGTTVGSIYLPGTDYVDRFIAELEKRGKVSWLGAAD